MDEVKNLLIQVLNEDEKAFSKDLLAKNGEATASQYYVRGYGSGNDMKVLKDKGMIVEVMPDDIAFAPWLGTKTSDANVDNTLLSSEDRNDDLTKLENESHDVYLIQLRGPMRAGWKQKLEEYGVKLINYKPDYAYKVMLTGKRPPDIEALDFVAKIEPLDATQRYDRIQEQTQKAAEADSIQADTIAQQKAEIVETVEKRTEVVESAEAIPDIQSFPGMATAGGDAPVLASIGDEMAAVAEEEQTSEPEPPAPVDELTSAMGGGLTLLKYDLKCHMPAQIDELGEKLKKDERVSDVEIGKLKIRFTCSSESPILRELAGMTSVVSKVEPFVEYTLTNNFVRLGIGIERLGNALPETVIPWTGKDVIVGVADSGIDQTHSDFTGKLTKVVQKTTTTEPNDPNGHGTHVCGVIAGNGQASNGLFRGVAKDAKLFVQELLDDEGKMSGIPLNVGELFKEAYDNDVRIHNNSWGVPADGIYSIASHEVDEFVYNHPDFLVIFAAGNEGRQIDNNNPDPQDKGRILYNSLRNPGIAKNALTVGACCSPRDDGPYKGKHWADFPNGQYPFTYPLVSNEPVSGDQSYLAAFSSRGPSDDERTKPDLVAPGTVILSTRSANAVIGTVSEGFDGKYIFLSGTSQAAPVVSGSAAIVYEYYKKEQNHKPSAALLKATLINGTTWIPRDSAEDNMIGMPNYHQGYGRIDLPNTLPLPDDNEFKLLFVDVNRGEDEALNKSDDNRAAWRKRVQVGKGKPFRVTLAWTDPPGHGLQQNLDLLIMTPNGQRLVGNNSMVRGPWQPADRQNNVEKVYIGSDELEEGNYTIFVLAVNTWSENQGFSLVATGNLKSTFLP